jgi:hypothetical protein
VRAERVGVHRHVDRLEPRLTERLLHQHLARLLVAERGRGLDEPHEQRLHPLRLGRDGGHDIGVADRRGHDLGRQHARERTSASGLQFFPAKRRLLDPPGACRRAR